MKDILEKELLEIQNELKSETDFIKKIELKDKELEIKLKLGLTNIEDNYEVCENCSA